MHQPKKEREFENSHELIEHQVLKEQNVAAYVMVQEVFPVLRNLYLDSDRS